MHLLKMAATGFIAACFSGVAFAEEANPITMAHEVGFVGCDKLIADVFESAINATEVRYEIRYFDETVKSSINFHATYGKPGANALITAHFEKKNGVCYSSERRLFSMEGNCVDLINKDEYFSYVDESAGVLWSKNKGGATKLFMPSGNACNQIYLIGDKQKATR